MPMSMASSNESYPWPSTLNISNFVSIKPCLKDKETSKDYKIWKEQMLCLLESQDLLGFINGEIQNPEHRNESSSRNEKSVEIHDNHKLWRRTDRLVKGWILGSIGDDVLNTLVVGLNRTSSSRELWLEVEIIFSQKKQVNAFQNKVLKSKSDDVLMQEGDRIVEVKSEVSTNGNAVDENGRDSNHRLSSSDQPNSPRSNSVAPLHRRTTRSSTTPAPAPNATAPLPGSQRSSSTNPQTQQSHQTSPCNLDFSKYLPLNKAAIRGDWETAKTIFDEHSEAAEAFINAYSETALHAAVETRSSNNFVKELLNLMSNDALALKNNMGNTALHVAAMVGNREAAILLVNRNADLLCIVNSKNELPVHLAAIFCHKDILNYLIVKSKENVNNSPFAGQLGISLLIYLIASEFLDVALELVKTYPDLATLKDGHGDCALSMMARRSLVFPSGTSFNWWQKFIYSCISDTTPYVGDIENLGINPQASNSSSVGSSKLNATVRTVMEYLAPASIATIKDKKVLHKQAIEIVKCLCQKLESWPGTEDSGFHRRSILIAAEFGIHEVVELIAEAFPLTIFVNSSRTGSNIMSLAIQNRHENVYNVIYQMSHLKNRLSGHMDKARNNIMHLSAKLAPPHKLNLVPGAALQMQRELQWFKETESIVRISRRTWKNQDGETPRMLFTKEHEDLKRQGEKWMRDTASSSSTIAALIVTVVFAAAFTLPGNVNPNTGIPIFWGKTPYIIFSITDIISLFTSVTSLVVFLSLLTSRYAEEDFLHVLPNRLCIGLLALFVSIIFMMVAFGAKAYLTFRKNTGWLLIIPVAVLACIPITSFTLLQFPILLDVVNATYGPGIFRKRSDRSFY